MKKKEVGTREDGKEERVTKKNGGDKGKGYRRQNSIKAKTGVGALPYSDVQASDAKQRVEEKLVMEKALKNGKKNRKHKLLWNYINHNKGCR